MPPTTPARRPTQDYFVMKLQVGDRLVFAGLPDFIVTVHSNRLLQWGGGEYYLTALRKKAAELLGKKDFRGPITVNGEDLEAIYDRTYRKKKPANP